MSDLGLEPTGARGSMALPEPGLAERDLGSLRVSVSTGAPRTPEAWLWTFDRIGGRRVPLPNEPGGTEVGGIPSGTAIHPLKPSAFAGAIPGTGADMVDAEAASVGPGATGEPVMHRPRIGLTCGLWHDRERRLRSEWPRWPGIWVDADFASRAPDGRGGRVRRTGARRLQQAVRSLVDKTRSRLRHRLRRHSPPARDDPVLDDLGARQSDSRPQREGLRGLAPERQCRRRLVLFFDRHQFRVGSSTHRRLVVSLRYPIDSDGEHERHERPTHVTGTFHRR